MTTQTVSAVSTTRLLDYESLVESGLQPVAHSPKRIVVVGAGMAGLVAAYELMRAGHDPLILEARGRVGGRVYTLREPFGPGLYAEAGAMRIPSTHHLTLAYAEKFGLGLSTFTMGNPQAYCHLWGERRRAGEVQANPDLLGFDLAPHERGHSPGQLFRRTVGPISAKFQAMGEAAWPEIYAEYDQYSTRDFLKLNRWTDGAIEMYGLLQNQESRLDTAFTELLAAELGREFTDLHQIDGGMDRLPNAFLPALRKRIRFGANVIALDQTPDSVTVHYQTAAGRAFAVGDYAILTLPFSVLRHVEVLKPFSRPKQRAIRELHYDTSGKIFFQCRRRFWEEDDAIFGGGTVTDLAIRNMYYPEHGRETGRGVLLASYTWAEDAQRWSALPLTDRITEALQDVAQIHPQIREEFEVGASHMWQDDPFACGAFALFEPGQKTDLHESIIAPEGRIHFAGEHASLTHRWIQGAIESGLRTAAEVHADGHRDSLRPLAAPADTLRQEGSYAQ